MLYISVEYPLLFDYIYGTPLTPRLSSYSTTAGVTLNRQYPDHPDGAEGPNGRGDGKSANGKKAAEGAEGHNPDASKAASEHGTHVIVASEPTTYKDQEWNLIEKNRVVLVGEHGLVGIEQL